MVQRIALVALACLVVVGPVANAPQNGAAFAKAVAPAPAPTSVWVDDQELSCTWPVKADDTLESLRARFPTQVAVATLAGPEGTTLPGVVLWPHDPDRVLEVAFTDDSRTHVDFLRANAPSRWSVLGLRNGEGIARVTAVNGRPFEFYGFGWDAAGNVSDFREGALDRFTPCRVIMTLTYAYDGPPPPDQLVGDVALLSDRPDIEPDLVRVDEIGLAFDPEY
ncbi:MAG: hypothetical protein KDE15_00815 [Erythrobacter sp.]|nr:hypothetical protein [Erythrobacter sp.]